MGDIWSLFLVGHLYLNGVDLRTDTIKTHVLRRLDYVFNFYKLLYA